jgi:hypothetical protein
MTLVSTSVLGDVIIVASCILSILSEGFVVFVALVVPSVVVDVIDVASFVLSILFTGLVVFGALNIEKEHENYIKALNIEQTTRPMTTTRSTPKIGGFNSGSNHFFLFDMDFPNFSFRRR